MIENITIGCDPEFFLRDNMTGKMVPACGLIGGSKENPLPISDKGHSIQEDNVMVEFNVPPARTADDLWSDIDFVKNFIKDKVIPKNLDILIIPSAHFEKADLMSEQAMTFGCSPDFNAWELSMNEVKLTDETLRASAGHIHIGYNNPNPDTSIAIIKAMDLFLGVQSVILDLDTERKKMYGKAGAFRFCKFGCEFRVLSNFWIVSKELTTWAFNGAMEAIEFAGCQEPISDDLRDNIVKAINTQDRDLAYSIYKKYAKPNELIEKAYIGEQEVKVATPENIEEAFKLLTT